MFPEMRRKRQQLSEEACVQILSEEATGTLAVLDGDGYPYGFPMHFYYEDGSLYFHSAKQGHKIDALRAHDRVSFSVVNSGYQDAQEFWNRSSVVAFGRISVVEDGDARMKRLRQLCEKNFSAEKTEAELRGAPAVLVLRMEIEHMTGKTVRY